MDLGALAHLQEECGWTGKDHLLQYWKMNRTDLDEAVQGRIKAVISRMETAIKGHELLPKKPFSNVFETEGECGGNITSADFLDSKENENAHHSSGSRPRLSGNRHQTDTTRKYVDRSPDIGEESSPVQSYVDVVSGLRNRKLGQSRMALSRRENHRPIDSVQSWVPHSNIRKKSLDDWLEDDITRPKRQKNITKGSANIQPKIQHCFKDPKRKPQGRVNGSLRSPYP